MTDQEYTIILAESLKDRENTFSKDPDPESIEWIFKSIIKPVLDKGDTPTFSNDFDKKKFVIETFALACYAKDNEINKWVYDPVLPNSNKTPDFFVNDTTYIEVYSPISDIPNDIKQDLSRQEDSGNLIASTGFLPASSFHHAVAKSYIEKKSDKYKDYKMTFLVHTAAGGFAKDMINSLKQVNLSSLEHHIVYYQGNSKKYYV